MRQSTEASFKTYFAHFLRKFIVKANSNPDVDSRLALQIRMCSALAGIFKYCHPRDGERDHLFGNVSFGSLELQCRRPFDDLLLGHLFGSASLGNHGRI